MMEHYICKTCGIQYASSEEVPSTCSICNDERQYVSPKGQEWTTLADMIKTNNYQNVVTKDEEHLYSIKTTPVFAIGQTAYVVQNQGFNLLWDCISYFDSNTKQQIKEWGGLNAIALSHPHYYSSQVEWAEAFDVPIYIHEDDQQWVTRESTHIIFWRGESFKLHEGLTLFRLGGHFKGGSVVHWENGNEGKGVLLSGDIIQGVADPKWVSFMYSYPNLIPLPASSIQTLASKVKPLAYNRLYTAFHKIVKEDADRVVQRSAERYIQALNGELIHQ